MAERGAQQVAGLLARDVDDDRTRDGVARHDVSASAAFAGAATERGEQFAGVLLARQLQQAAARDAPRIEDVARPIEQADDADLALTVGRGDLIGERAADAAEAEEHDVGARRRRGAAAADLRQLKRGVDAARRLGGLIGVTANEMLRSDEPCAIATTLMPPVASAENTRAATPGVPTMPSPTTATTAMPGRAVTLSIEPRAQFVAERRAQAARRRARPRSRAP